MSSIRETIQKIKDYYNENGVDEKLTLIINQLAESKFEYFDIKGILAADLHFTLEKVYYYNSQTYLNLLARTNFSSPTFIEKYIKMHKDKLIENEANLTPLLKSLYSKAEMNMSFYPLLKFLNFVLEQDFVAAEFNKNFLDSFLKIAKYQHLAYYILNYKNIDEHSLEKVAATLSNKCKCIDLSDESKISPKVYEVAKIAKLLYDKGLEKSVYDLIRSVCPGGYESGELFWERNRGNIAQCAYLISTTLPVLCERSKEYLVDAITSCRVPDSILANSIENIDWLSPKQINVIIELFKDDSYLNQVLEKCQDKLSPPQIKLIEDKANTLKQAKEEKEREKEEKTRQQAEKRKAEDAKIQQEKNDEINALSKTVDNLLK